MPTLPAFMSYRPQLKGKVKSPFAKRRFDSLSTPSSQPFPPETSQSILKVGNNRRNNSLDFSDSSSPSFDHMLRPMQTPRPPSPRIQLELDLNSDPEQLSDWFSNPSFSRKEPSPKARGYLTQPSTVGNTSEGNPHSDMLIEEEVFEDNIEDIASGDVISNLEAMNASSFGRRRPEIVKKTRKESPIRLKDPSRQALILPDEDGAYSRPLSELSSSPSSAVSGTTLARQLMGNGFSLSHDHRTSRYRSFVGLTRTDSTTLPPVEYDQRFEVGPDAPPIPWDAETLYVAPKASRSKAFRRQSVPTPEHNFSTTDMAPLSRPSSDVFSLTEIHSVLPPPPSGHPPSPPNSNPEHQERKKPPAIDISATEIRTSPAEDPVDPSPHNPDEEDVLEYYSFSGSYGGETPVQRGFRPIFTPITEESLSQLSPPAPYTRSDRRDSQRSQPLGARSPGSPSFRVRSMMQRSASQSAASSSSILSVVHEIEAPPHTVSVSTTSLASSISNSSDTHQDSSNTLNESLLAPPLSKVFNRQRSGSAPSPIKVILDEDLSKYKITVASRGVGNNPSSTPDTVTEQQFPETATAPWSAAFSLGGASDIDATEAPKSATLPSTSVNIRPTLLTRAATSARAIPSRQASQGVQRGYLPLAASGVIEETPESPRHNTKAHHDGDAKTIPPQRPPPKRSLPPSPNAGRRSPLKLPSHPHREPVTPSHDDIVATPHAAHQVARSLSSATSTHSTDSVSASTPTSINSVKPPAKSLPPIPSPPLAPPPRQVTHGSRPRIPQPLELSQASVPLQIVAEGPPPPDQISSQTTMQATSLPLNSGPRPQPETPVQPSFSHKSTDTVADILRASATLCSPPPYYTVVDQLHSQPTSNRLLKMARPAGPLGPRRPSLQTSLPFPSQIIGRDRSGSSASLTRQASSAGPSRPSARRTELTPSASPKFQPPPIKHRGYTMEAAKWTFTSSQLQSVVSRAIRESAQTSSIRLLKLESLDEEIPEEIHRLEMYRTDIKSKYKASTRRRAHLLESLAFHLSNSSAGEEPTSTVPIRIVEELSSIATFLDRLAEELHGTDLQLVELSSLVQVHSSSALSMALRKLNTSFLNQVAENKVLQERIDLVEAERDEAWKYAEEIANEYDHLNFQDKPDESPVSNRSSRISAKRKSSIRASKAGLRYPQSRRQSARLSISSIGHGPTMTTPLTSSKPPFRMAKVPPLPPIPKRRPAGIITDYQSPLTSSNPLSMDGTTPDSDIRAMAQAEEEVYNMLGLAVPDSGVIKRSQSMVGLPSGGISPSPLSDRMGAHARRSSLPGEATLIEAQNAMLAHRNAVVFTFEMLRDDDDEHAGPPYIRF